MAHMVKVMFAPVGGESYPGWVNLDRILAIEDCSNSRSGPLMILIYDKPSEQQVCLRISRIDLPKNIQCPIKRRKTAERIGSINSITGR